MCVEEKELNKLLDQYQNRIKNINQKSWLLIFIISLIAICIASVSREIQMWSWITIIVLSLFNILILLLSLFPKIWSSKFKEKELIYYTALAFKNSKKVDLGETITITNYEEKLNIIAKLIKFKNAVLKISIVLLNIIVVVILVIITLAI